MTETEKTRKASTFGKLYCSSLSCTFKFNNFSDKSEKLLTRIEGAAAEERFRLDDSCDVSVHLNSKHFSLNPFYSYHLVEIY